jgi:transaldolase
VLAASLKSVDEVAAALKAGAHHVTMPLDLIMNSGEHELTRQAMAEFAAQLSELAD